jgi:hypothetical protein
MGMLPSTAYNLKFFLIPLPKGEILSLYHFREFCSSNTEKRRKWSINRSNAVSKNMF